MSDISIHLIMIYVILCNLDDVSDMESGYLSPGGGDCNMMTTQQNSTLTNSTNLQTGFISPPPKVNICILEIK